MEAEFDGMVIKMPEGNYKRYNGLDVLQTRNYVKIGCESYIDHVLQTHGWDTPSDKDRKMTVPLSTTVSDNLQKLERPAKKKPEAKEIEKDIGILLLQPSWRIDECLCH